jgi:hypothetical protein
MVRAVKVDRGRITSRFTAELEGAAGVVADPVAVPRLITPRAAMVGPVSMERWAGLAPQVEVLAILAETVRTVQAVAAGLEVQGRVLLTDQAARVALGLNSMLRTVRAAVAAAAAATILVSLVRVPGVMAAFTAVVPAVPVPMVPTVETAGRVSSS